MYILYYKSHSISHCHPFWDLKQRSTLQAEHLNPFCCQSQRVVLEGTHKMGLMHKSLRKNRVRICFFIKRKQISQNLCPERLSLFSWLLAMAPTERRIRIKGFLNTISYLANLEGWIFQDVSTSYTTKCASAFLKAAQFCKHGLNFEHFAYQPFSILSLSQTCSLLLSFFHPFLSYATHRFQKTKQKHFLWESLHTHFKKRPFLFALCGVLQFQLCTAASTATMRLKCV